MRTPEGEVKEIRLLVDSPDFVVAAVLVAFDGRSEEWRFRAYFTGFPLSQFTSSLEKGQEGLLRWCSEPPEDWSPFGWTVRLTESALSGRAESGSLHQKGTAR